MNFEPDGKAKIRIILNHYRLLGLKDTLKETALYLLSRIGEDDFDRRYGVSTEGIIEPTDAGIQDEVARNLAIKYAPTREAVMRHILQRALSGQNAQEYTYIDLGCGKGRTLIMAAQFPFRAVVGVELSPIFHEVAEDNILRYTAGHDSIPCTDMRAVCSNVLDFEFPDSNLLIYMFRPFLGPVFQKVLDRLHEFHVSTGRQVLVAYSCPLEQPLLEQHPGFAKRDEYQVVTLEYSWNLWECVGSTNPQQNGVRPTVSMGREPYRHASQ